MLKTQSDDEADSYYSTKTERIVAGMSKVGSTKKMDANGHIRGERKRIGTP